MDLFLYLRMSECGQGETQRRRGTGRQRDAIIFTAWHYFICVLILLYMSSYYCVIMLLHRVWARGNAKRRGTGWQSEERRIDWPFKKEDRLAFQNKSRQLRQSCVETADCTPVALAKCTSCTSKVQVLHTSKVPLWSMWSSVKFVKWPNSSGRFFRLFWSNQIRCNFCNSPISCLQHM